ncbi:MAG: hypothetical protein LBQ50_12380, partial [Planctomycetaceae bacterium]|nr:hypothetical protein [Planctomycetaceae bacterium]
MNCRFCGKNLTHLFVDLGTAPLSNSFLKQEQLDNGECYYPLKVQVCDNCFLVQIDEFKRPAEIFSDDYVYLSSVSKSWLDHAKRFVNTIKERLQLDAKLFVIEIASNDGYLLQYVK